MSSKCFFVLFVCLVVVAIYGNAYACRSTQTQQYVSCREGWFLFGEKCYKMFSERRTWDEASERCSAEGGHLATVSSKELQDFLIAFLILDERYPTWIGLNDLEMESNYTWQDGTAVTYTNWGPGEPSFRHENCVEIINLDNSHLVPQPYWGKLGIWNDAFCGLGRSFICQVDTCQGVETPSPDPRFCSIEDGGGFKYRESCFHIVSTKKSWEEAQNHCEENFSGNLVKILDREAEIFLDYILSDTKEDFWIGIRKENATVQKWVSGWHVVFNRFNRDFAQHPTEATCIVRTHKQFWTFADCSIEFPFICERSNVEAPVLKKAPEGWECPRTSDAWRDLEGESCYIFGTERNRNWLEANRECEKHCGTLASITSEEESRVLQHYVITNSVVSIGLHRDVSNKQQFRWLDGSDFEYTNWRDGEPNNEDEECVELFSNTMKWNDKVCNLRGRTYICSVKKVRPSQTEGTTSTTEPPAE